MVCDLGKGFSQVECGSLLLPVKAPIFFLLQSIQTRASDSIKRQCQKRFRQSVPPRTPYSVANDQFVPSCPWGPSPGRASLRVPLLPFTPISPASPTPRSSGDPYRRLVHPEPSDHSSHLSLPTTRRPSTTPSDRSPIFILDLLQFVQYFIVPRTRCTPFYSRPLFNFPGSWWLSFGSRDSCEQVGASRVDVNPEVTREERNDLGQWEAVLLVRLLTVDNPFGTVSSSGGVVLAWCRS